MSKAILGRRPFRWKRNEKKFLIAISMMVTLHTKSLQRCLLRRCQFLKNSFKISIKNLLTRDLCIFPIYFPIQFWYLSLFFSIAKFRMAANTDFDEEDAAHLQFPRVSFWSTSQDFWSNFVNWWQFIV